MEPNTKQIDVPRRRYEGWTSHLSDEEIPGLSTCIGICVLRDAWTKIEDQLYATIWQNSLNLRLIDGIGWTQSPQALNKSIERRIWMEFTVLHDF